MKRNSEMAEVSYDPERPEEAKRADKIVESLRTLGIQAILNDIYFDEQYPAPPMPWLQYNGHTYYSHEIESALAVIANPLASDE